MMAESQGIEQRERDTLRASVRKSRMSIDHLLGTMDKMDDHFKNQKQRAYSWRRDQSSAVTASLDLKQRLETELKRLEMETRKMREQRERLKRRSEVEAGIVRKVSASRDRLRVNLRALEVERDKMRQDAEKMRQAQHEMEREKAKFKAREHAASSGKHDQNDNELQNLKQDLEIEREKLRQTRLELEANAQRPFHRTTFLTADGWRSNGWRHPKMSVSSTLKEDSLDMNEINRLKEILDRYARGSKHSENVVGDAMLHFGAFLNKKLSDHEIHAPGMHTINFRLQRTKDGVGAILALYELLDLYLAEKRKVELSEDHSNRIKNENNYLKQEKEHREYQWKSQLKAYQDAAGQSRDSGSHR